MNNSMNNYNMHASLQPRSYRQYKNRITVNPIKNLQNKCDQFPTGKKSISVTNCKIRSAIKWRDWRLNNISLCEKLFSFTKFIWTCNGCDFLKLPVYILSAKQILPLGYLAESGMMILPTAYE